jgi:hypothetical protein
MDWKNLFSKPNKTILEERLEDYVEDGNLSSFWKMQVPADEWEAAADMLYNSTQYTSMLRKILEKLHRKAKDGEDKAYASRNFELTRANIDGYKKALKDIYRLLPTTRRN